MASDLKFIRTTLDPSIPRRRFGDQRTVRSDLCKGCLFTSSRPTRSCRPANVPEFSNQAPCRCSRFLVHQGRISVNVSDSQCTLFRATLEAHAGLSMRRSRQVRPSSSLTRYSLPPTTRITRPGRWRCQTSALQRRTTQIIQTHLPRRRVMARNSHNALRKGQEEEASVQRLRPSVRANPNG